MRLVEDSYQIQTQEETCMSHLTIATKKIILPSCWQGAPLHPIVVVAATFTCWWCCHVMLGWATCKKIMTPFLDVVVVADTCVLLIHVLHGLVSRHVGSTQGLCCLSSSPHVAKCHNSLLVARQQHMQGVNWYKVDRFHIGWHVLCNGCPLLCFICIYKSPSPQHTCKRDAPVCLHVIGYPVKMCIRDVHVSMQVNVIVVVLCAIVMWRKAYIASLPITPHGWPLFEASKCIFFNSHSFISYLYTIHWDMLYVVFFIARLCVQHGTIWALWYIIGALFLIDINTYYCCVQSFLYYNICKVG